MRKFTHRYVARFTLEVLTPLSIGTGFGAGLFDTELVRDANGLPTIPGTAFAGVLSSLYRLYYPARYHEWRKLFGYEDEDRKRDHADKGQASRLEFSFGYIHDEKDQAVDCLALDEERLSDKLLSFALGDAPVKRDHVKINHRGVVDGQQKFDRVSLPPGYRFSFEIAMWGYEGDEDGFFDALRLLNASDFRLGGATRRGLGKLGLVADEGKGSRLFYRRFDLENGQDRKAFVAYRNLAAIDDKPEQFALNGEACPGFCRRELPALGEGESERRSIPIRLKLKPIDFWRFGSGNTQLSEKKKKDDKSADSLPLTEPRINYVNGCAQIMQAKNGRLAIPASAIKGPLVHRAEFHLKCNDGDFAEKLAKEDFNLRGMDEVFGSAKAKDDTLKNANDSSLEEDDNPSRGMAGLVIIDDAYIDLENGAPETMVSTHNTIDRFSGGVMNGRLFTEEVLYGGEIAIELTVLTARPKVCKKEPARELEWVDVETKYWQALDKALADLCEGRLALGADGHGYMELADGQKAPEIRNKIRGTYD